MSSFITLAFWFNLRPGNMGSTPRTIFIGLIISLIVLAVAFFILKKRKGFYRNFYSSLYDFSVSNAFIAILLLFFNYEIVPFFSAHFWFLLWLIAAVWWLLSILKGLKKIAVRKKQKTEVDEIKKYLP